MVGSLRMTLGGRVFVHLLFPGASAIAVKLPDSTTALVVALLGCLVRVRLAAKDSEPKLTMLNKRGGHTAAREEEIDKCEKEPFCIRESKVYNFRKDQVK